MDDWTDHSATPHAEMSMSRLLGAEEGKLRARKRNNFQSSSEHILAFISGNELGGSGLYLYRKSYEIRFFREVAYVRYLDCLRVEVGTLGSS